MKTFIELVTEIKQCIDQEDNKALANIEDSIELTATATLPHVLGSYLIYGKKVYEVTTPISVGDTLVIYPTTGYNIKVADDIMTMIETLRTENQTLTNEVNAMVNVYGAKNLLANKMASDSVVTHGITFARQSDGSVHVTGSTDGTVATIYYYSNFNKSFPVDVIASGGVENGIQIDVFWRDSGGTAHVYVAGASEIKIPANTFITSVALTVTDPHSNVDVTFKPMFRDARIVDSTYEPYAMTNQELTEDVSALNSAVNNTYQLIKIGSVGVVGDGVKTYQEKLYELASALISYWSNKPNNWRADARLLYTPVLGTIIPNYGNMITKSSNVALNFMFAAGDNSLRLVSLSSGGQGYNNIKKITFGTNGNTITDFTNEVIPDGDTINVQLTEYEIISL